MSEARTPWYVVQSVAGREEHTRSLVLQAVELEERAMREQAADASDAPSPGEQPSAAPVLQECFVPRMRVGRKQQGKWLPAEETLLPGYLIAITERPEALVRALRRVDGFARVLTQDGTPIPLPREETTWLETQTRRGKSAVGMSEGYVEGGVLHVTSGPLMGREAWVRRVNHRKKVAYLELDMFGRKVSAQLGIRITRNRDCKKKLTRE